MSADGLPDFLIVGAQKAGTSSLHRYLAQHPGIAGSKPKEVHYFDGGRSPDEDVFALGPDWYRSRLPDAAPGRLILESTPRYLFHPDCAARIHALLPRARLIVLLRDPVERAISHYFHNRRAGREPLAMAEAFAAEPDRAAASGPGRLHPLGRYAYLARGRYAGQLRRYFALFDRDRIHIEQSERLFDDAPAALARALAFLGLPPPPARINFRPRNVGDNRAPADPALVAGLRAGFRAENAALFDLLGRRFDWPDAD